MQTGPRQIINSFRPIPLDVPEGMAPNEFFNSTENTGRHWGTRIYSILQSFITPLNLFSIR